MRNSTRIGVIGAAMDVELGTIFRGTTKYLEKCLNISATFDELTVDSVADYDGSGDLSRETDLYLIPIDSGAIRFWERHVFTSVVDYSSGIIVSGAPEMVLRIAFGNFFIIKPKILLSLLVSSFFVWFVQFLISAVLEESEPAASSLTTRRFCTYMAEILALNLTIIQKPLTIRMKDHLSTKVLFVFWLISLTLLLYNDLSHFNAKACYVQYATVDGISDIVDKIGENPNIKAKLVRDGVEHIDVKLRARKDEIYKTLLEIIERDESKSFLETFMDILEEDLYYEVSTGNALLISNGITHEMASCIPLKEIDSGKISLHVSKREFLPIKFVYFVRRNVSNSLYEKINLRLMDIFETRAFYYVLLDCRYNVYHKNVWKQPTEDIQPRLSLSDTYVNFRFLVASMALVFLSTICENLYHSRQMNLSKKDRK